jgi:hypothetical protein
MNISLWCPGVRHPQGMRTFHIIFKIDLPGRVSRMNRTHSVNMDTMRWACGPSAVIQGRRTDRSSVSCCIQAAVGSFRFLVQYGANHGENIWVRAGHSCSHTEVHHTVSYFTFECCILLCIYPTGSLWRRQSQQSFNTLTPFNFFFYSLHVIKL